MLKMTRNGTNKQQQRPELLLLQHHGAKLAGFQALVWVNTVCDLRFDCVLCYFCNYVVSAH